MKEMKNAKTIGIVREREREREHNLEKLSFICDAQNKVEIKNKYESINKTDYSAMKEKRKTPTLQISLFFW